MSKFACHVDKFKGSQLYGMDIHIQRKTDNHANKDIDVSRSNQNYDFVENAEKGHYYTLAKNRIEQGYTGKKKIRKDAVWTGSAVISSDNAFFSNLSEDQERQYFKTCYDYLCQKYGKENIISAKVHKDETTPHMHVLIVPLTADGRLCSKELFDRNALRDLQEEMPKLLKAKGFKIERGDKDKKTKRLETDEWKKLKKENQVIAKIDPSEIQLFKKGEEKTLFGKKDIVETPEDVANRLTEKHLKPLADELSDLKTDLAAQKKREEKQKYEIAFTQSREKAFVDLYTNAKKFGQAHVDNVLEKVTALVERLNAEKIREEQQKQHEKEQRQKERLAQNELLKLEKIALKLGCDKNHVGEFFDMGKAPYKFEDNTEQSYYIAMKTLKGTLVAWGNELKKFVEDTALRIGSYIQFSGVKVIEGQNVTLENPQIISDKIIKNAIEPPKRAVEGHSFRL